MTVVILSLVLTATGDPARRGVSGGAPPAESTSSGETDVVPNTSRGEPSFGRDVRPILAKHCFTCHGPDPDAREAGLRLDQAESAHADLGGYAAITPGDPESSEMMVRVSTDDFDVRMPPAETHPPLSPTEIEVLRRWIEAGGRYEKHWAFVPPRQSPVPDVATPQWCRGPIDRFVLAGIEAGGLRPSKTAGRVALARRLFLDLAGINPTPEQVDRFVRDESPTAYRKLVDRLLASPEYAERMARPWLDLARYSDTNGYEKDRPRTIWPFRDWVIRALAADMPYDQFSIEQLAGDMLPNATASQQIATGFHRNTMMNEEGGIDPLEYRFYSLVDRVATTGTVWMGLTVGCAQCHTHKYDPITHTDFYSLMALLDHADEPDVVVPDEAASAKAAQIRKQIASEEQTLAKKWLPPLAEAIASDSNSPSSNVDDANVGNLPVERVRQAFRDWLSRQWEGARDWRSLRPTEMRSTMPKLTRLSDDSVLASGDVTKRDVYHLRFELGQSEESATALRLEVLPHPSLPDGGPGMAFYEGRRGDFFLSELKVTIDGSPVGLRDASHSFGKVSVGSGSADAANVIDGDGSTGWSTSGKEGDANRLVVNFDEPLTAGGTLEVELLFERHFAAALGRFRLSLTNSDQASHALDLSPDLEEALRQSESRRETIAPDDYDALQRQFVRTADELKGHRNRLSTLQGTLPRPVRTLGMRQRSPEDYRQTHRHERGEYLNPAEMVTPAVPAAFSKSPSATSDRLALARWLVSEQNPLAARVAVNRWWREFFGTGIVHTAGDFGTQSEPPSHPELLDWLSIDLREGGWSMKRMHRQIVLSASYRQAVGDAPESDPANRLLATFPYRRLNAERIRDVVLSASGLLTRSVGGPSVYPPQPASVSQLAYGSPQWNVSKGADRYRRSLYTFGKRTAPFAAFTAFDAPTGEVCVARRDPSTTPLQALTLLNDGMYIELARGLADSVNRELGVSATAERRAVRIFRRLLSRTPEPTELDQIMAFYREVESHQEPWTLVSRALMNADEVITTP